MNGSRQGRIERVPALDGLRGVAIAAVLAFHSGFRIARGGFLGVSLFFTISGYVITTLLVDELHRDGRIDLLGFWERRFRRLAPAALMTLAGIAIAAHFFADPTQRAALRGDVLSAVADVANWRFLARGQSYAALFRAPSPVLHFWSLAIEEQFYIVFPVIVAVVTIRARSPRRTLLITLIVLASASVVAQLTVSGFDRVYFGTDTRLFEIAIGAVLATVAYQRLDRVARMGAGAGVLGLIAFALFGAAVVDARIGASWLAHGGLALVALVNVALVMSVLVPGPCARTFAFRPLVAIGRVSYGLYLIHWPVFLWLDQRRTGLDGVPLLMVRLAVVVPLTVASYHLLECPVRFGRRLQTGRRFVTAFASGLTAVVAVALAFPVAAAAPLTSPSELAAALGNPPPTSGPLRVMVVGDSTGESVARGLAAAHDPHLVVDDATQSSCPILDAPFTRLRRGDPPHATSGCAARTHLWLEHAKRFHPNLVLVVSSVEDAGDHANRTAGFWANIALPDFYAATVKEYQQAARALLATGAVVAWADVPYYTFAGHANVRVPEYLDARVQLLNGAITEVTAAQLGVVTLDFASHLDRPDGAIDLAQRPDGIHLAPSAAAQSARAWLDHELVLAYADAEREIGVRVGTTTATRVLVTGDSTSLAIAAGLGNHGRAHGDVVVDWAGQIACPLVHANEMHGFVDDRDVPVSGCKSFTTLWEQQVRAFRPDVVLVVSSLIDASDLNFGNSWEHIGQPRYDDRYRAAMTAAIDSFRKAGVTVLWASAPRAQLPTAAATRTINQRFRRLNEIIAATVTARGAREVPFAAHIDRADGTVDLGARPDGVHFTVEAATRVADEWLAAAIVKATAHG